MLTRMVISKYSNEKQGWRFLRSMETLFEGVSLGMPQAERSHTLEGVAPVQECPRTTSTIKTSSYQIAKAYKATLLPKLQDCTN